jgi:hypothetical protein
MILGDYIIHTPISDPESDFTSNELSLSNPYFLTALDTGYSLLITPGIYTSITNVKAQRSSLIDVCFGNPHLLPFIHFWKNNLPPSGSDHTLIRVIMTRPSLMTTKSCKTMPVSPWQVTVRRSSHPYPRGKDFPSQQPKSFVTLP